MRATGQVMKTKEKRKRLHVAWLKLFQRFVCSFDIKNHTSSWCTCATVWPAGLGNYTFSQQAVNSQGISMVPCLESLRG